MGINNIPVSYKGIEAVVQCDSNTGKYKTIGMNQHNQIFPRELSVEAPTYLETIVKFFEASEGFINGQLGANYVYICSPYRGDIEKNTEIACTACKLAVKSGYIPIAPHIYFTQFLDDNGDERAVGLQMGLAMLKLCSEIWIVGDTITEGMRAEISEADKLSIRKFSVAI